MPTLIYIHGRGLKESEQAEQAKWYQSLAEGLTRLSPEQLPEIGSAQLKLAYWSDIFYPTLPTENNLQGLAAHEQAIVELMMIQFKAAQAAGRLGAVVGMPLPPDDPRRVFGPLRLPTSNQAKQSGDDFLRDVIKYFGLGYAAKVRVPFVSLLTDLPLDDGLMVVSHSFGTLIAYDVLLSSLDQINTTRAAAGKRTILVDTLVTMGSPLGWAHDLQKMFPTFAQDLLIRGAVLEQDVARGLGQIRDFFGGLFHHAQPAPAPNPGPGVATMPVLYELPPKQFPPKGVDRWLNIFDPRDPVSAEFGIGALTIADTFLYGQAGATKERAFDISIKNEYAPNDSWAVNLEAHNDRGYGKSAQLAQLVHDFWFRWQRPADPAA